MMDYKISGRYKVTACFEITVDIDGYSFLVIYGRHVNGGFCCIPNWGVGCEASTPGDTFYNREKLIRHGISDIGAKAIAYAIRDEAIRRGVREYD